ncbi:hypothetical protein CXB51_009663 [Gossypium anomalum]|uniref:Reverse transcriptase zinc-binding domain-containing protein n=1 Tax=Gossypium anomalum TaxID=47600 RepID=A0A8J6D1G7_9ROSI|nr:hypothetical protein CXB51_009663 [Gossypium anomalum]
MAKWIWRFVVDREALWRKIIVAKYGSPAQQWQIRTSNLKDMSMVWRGIVENAKDSKASESGISNAVSFSHYDERVGERLFDLEWKLTELLMKEGMDDIYFAFDKIWKLKVPPRMRSFLWLFSIDRLPIKEFLIRRGVQISQMGSGCPWCNREPEKVSVWLARNEIVFDRKWLTMSSLVFHSKKWALMWVRSIQEELKVDERSWWICPFRSWSDLKKSGLSGRLWCPSNFGCVKFNVCSVANEDEVGCGGVLRDSDGWQGHYFRVHLQQKTPSQLSWVENKGLRRWLLHTIFKEIEIRMFRVGNVSFSKADKHGNKMAFALVVAGMKRPECNLRFSHNVAHGLVTARMAYSAMCPDRVEWLSLCGS